MHISLILSLLLWGSLSGCGTAPPGALPGAYRTGEILTRLEDRSIALVVNHTSVVEGTHLVDTLISRGIPPGSVVRLFTPEHGLRGNADAGASVKDGRDPLTGIEVTSLYGSNRKPRPEHLQGVDLVVFDLQDVGVRFYTYISTLHNVMESCAENGVPLLVLDRPNPNGGYVDGPVLEPGLKSFVGMHPIPVVYGMTIGELARMINGEGWLKGGVQCDLEVIPCTGYRRSDSYSLPVNPSPNLRTDQAIRLYPTTCFFEGTVLSEGRGTPWPFEVYGHPRMPGEFSFVPVPVPGAAAHPKHRNVRCFGTDLRDFRPSGEWNRIVLSILLDAYSRFPDKEEFFTDYFDTLAGTRSLRKQMENGWSEERIRESWKEGIARHIARRLPYLMYD